MDDNLQHRGRNLTTTIANELMKNGTGFSVTLAQYIFIPMATRECDVSGSEVMGEKVLDANLVVSRQRKEIRGSAVEICDGPGGGLIWS